MNNVKTDSNNTVYSAQIDLTTLGTSVSSATEQTTAPVGKPGNKTFLTTSPTLTADKDKKGPPGLEKLFEYLTEIMFIQIGLSSDQSKLNASTNGLSNDMVGLLQNTFKESIEKLAEYKAMQDAQENQGIWQKVVGIVASAILMVVGALTGQPELIVMAAIMIVMQSGGQEALDKALSNLSPGLKILVEAAIAVGVAIITGGASALTSTAEVVENVGADALEEGLAEGAGSAVEGGVDAVEQVETQVSDAVASNLKSVGNIVKGGPIGTALSHLSKALMMGSFWQDSVTQIAKAFGASDDIAGIIGGAVGTAVGLASAYGCNKLEAERNFTGLIKFFQNKGSTLAAGRLSKLTTVFKWTGTAAVVTGGGLGISQAHIEYNEYQNQNEQADQRYGIVLYQGILDILGRLCTQIQDGFKTVQRDYSDIMQASDKFLTPYDPNVVMA